MDNSYKMWNGIIDSDFLVKLVVRNDGKIYLKMGGEIFKFLK